jgi:hypothetical protein
MATCINDFQKTVVYGDGVVTQFAIQGAASPYAANYRVDIDGVLQEPDTDYIIDSNGNINFTSVPPNGSKIVIIADSTDASIFVPGQPLQNISPNAPDIITILKTECIGNSLTTINNNFANLRQAICTIDNFVAAANIKINQLDQALSNITSLQLAQAFVSFNGAKNTSNIDDITNSERLLIQSFNIDNVKRIGIGNYEVTFTTPFADTKYLMVGTARNPNIVTYSNTAVLPETITIQIMNDAGNLVDTDLISLVFYNN